jgi:D-methionine transport system substrate-binding protein
MGVYSKKHKSLADIKSGAKVALPNDPSNLARALLVLQQAGLSGQAGREPCPHLELDLAANPTSSSSWRWRPPSCRACWKTPTMWWSTATLPFVRPEAERSRGAGKDPDQYLNVVAVKTGNENSQWAKDLAAAYRSPSSRPWWTASLPATPSRPSCRRCTGREPRPAGLTA